MELNHLTVIFTLVLKVDLVDRYALFSLRAPFEAAFREAVGCRRGECRGCARMGDCSFAATFSQGLSRDPEAVRRHQKPPLPFVFRMPALPAPPNAGSRCECSLTLFGSAIQRLDDYLAALRLVVATLPAELAGLEFLCPGGARVPLPAGPAAAQNPLPLLSAADPVAAGPLAADAVTVELVTPLRLIQDGRALLELDFPRFVRPLLRRVSAMAHYYGGIELPLDYRALSAASERVECLESRCRFATWKNFSGLVGTLTFSGDLEPFHLPLLLGRAMNLGKRASFGLGEFRVS